MVQVTLTEDQANSLRIVVRAKCVAMEARIVRQRTQDMDTDAEQTALGYWRGILSALGDLPTW